jgi:UDP-N-acetylglucosamine 4,6-dehydratase/5-epimerase
MLDNKTILITGGTGSWGNELVRQMLLNFSPKQVRIYSRGEHRQVEMRQKFQGEDTLKFIIGDVRDKNILNLAMKGVDVVFHLAALKHVPICEDNVWEAVLTNIYGTQNVVEAAIANGVDKVVDISTDKAVDAFNLYGMTKACAEKIVVNAGFNYMTETKFICIRGGNVIGTNGSVIPLFKKQIIENNEVTLTDPRMTRYLMNTGQAISLVFKALEMSQGGETLVMRMPATDVQTMANSMIELFGDETTKATVIGSRPGEKLDEVLISKNEALNAYQAGDDYFVILPQNAPPQTQAYYESYPKIAAEEFNSRNAVQLSQADLTETLSKEAWLMS